MIRYNFPTTVFYGEGSLNEMAMAIAAQGLKKPLIVSDPTLKSLGMVDEIQKICADANLECSDFCDVHPNPIEKDVQLGAAKYKAENCDCFIALGGGSPMDAAKGMMILIDHPEPLAQYDDTKGGDALIKKSLPPLFAIATTAGTGSEVGRSCVIIIEKTNDKTILFHPTMMPRIAVLEPRLTVKLPQAITVATGLDAFTHNLEAYFAPMFHPMADGIALQGLELILDNLKEVYENPENLEARGKMLMASAMGATAFQKGLGMIHSMAHPLSSECGLHHGLANALCLPTCVEWLEKSDLNKEQRARIDRVQGLFKDRGLGKKSLSESCEVYFRSLGIRFGLGNHGVDKSDLENLVRKAVADPCHANNMIPVTERDFKKVFDEAY